MVEKQDQEKYAATPSLGKLLLLHWKWSLSFVVGILVFFVLPVFRVVGLWWGLVVIVISFVVCSFVLMKLVAMDNAARSEAEPNDSMSDAQNRVPTFFWSESPLSYLTTQNHANLSR